MRFWNFTHSLNLHVYYFIALAILLAMVISRLVQRRNQKKRDKDAEEHLKELEEALTSSGSEEKSGNVPQSEELTEGEGK